MGRRKIEIQPLADDRNRTVTFVKRKAGLFKKAHELAVLCQVDLAVIIVGDNNKVYEFSSVDTMHLLDVYQKNPPHELKLPENYGNYRKKVHLSDKHEELHSVPADDVPESDYETDTPEPKRRRTLPAPIYPPRPTKNEPLHRPVLRVQIPSDAKSPDLDKTVTALDDRDKKMSKFKSPDRPGKMQLPLPKLATASPSSASVPQLPGPSFYSLMPQQLPTAQFPAILPTPVLNQVFPQWHPDDKNQGEQTPMLALPLRYTNDIFPSPLNPYQEWLQGSQFGSVPHYFAPPLGSLYANSRGSMLRHPPQPPNQ